MAATCRLTDPPLIAHRRTLPPCPTPCSAATAASDADVLPQQMLRKYITYAKQTCRPKLQAADYDKIAKVGAGCGSECVHLERAP